MFRIARKQAEQSQFKRARVGAVIVKGGRVLSCGFNEIRHHKLLSEKPYPESTHAEEAAIVRLLQKRRQHDLVGADIYVCRINRAGESRLARPCSNCERLIRSVGIRNVYWTTNDRCYV